MNLWSWEKKNRFLYKTITPISMVKIVDFNGVRNFWQKVYCVYVFFDLHLFWIFTRSMFSIKLSCNIDDLKSSHLI